MSRNRRPQLAIPRHLRQRQERWLVPGREYSLSAFAAINPKFGLATLGSLAMFDVDTKFGIELVGAAKTNASNLNGAGCRGGA